MTRAGSRVAGATVFVRGLEVMAEIGVHAYEHGTRQPLVVDMEVAVDAAGWRHLGDTADYDSLVATAREVAAVGHIGLVESYAQRLAEALVALPRVASARVRVEKPRALDAGPARAGVEITAVRD